MDTERNELSTNSDMEDDAPDNERSNIALENQSHQDSISNDSELDAIISSLHELYPAAGETMLMGALRGMGLRITRHRLRASIRQVDPVQRLFERIRIERRVYSVAGPNALWHHDGQHSKYKSPVIDFSLPVLTYYKTLKGLICWGIVIHGFIDGYSRVITGLRASNNNRGATVLDIFLEAARKWGVPSRIRGDHGTENILVASWIEVHCRPNRYIWGQYVLY